MAGVRQVRVLPNVVCILGLYVLMLWLVRTRPWEHRVALAIGEGAGLVFGLWWWRRQRRVARRDRRYERNKVFVHYLNSFEVIVAVLVYDLYEGLLYQVGTVVQPLAPTGKIMLAGVL